MKLGGAQVTTTAFYNIHEEAAWSVTLPPGSARKLLSRKNLHEKKKFVGSAGAAQIRDG
jgi:hypothetical protein